MSRIAVSRRLAGAVIACVLVAVVLAVPSRSDEDPAALARRIDRLVAQLGAESFKDREQAAVELASLGEKAKTALEHAVRTTTDQEVKQRAERLLASLGAAKGEGSAKGAEPREVTPEDADPLQRSLELLRESFRRGMPRLRLDMNLDPGVEGTQRVVVIEDGVRYEFKRDKAGAFEVIVTQDDKSTRHAFKDEAELKAAQPALHERWARMRIDLSGAGGGPAGEAMRRMIEEQRKLMEKLLEGEGFGESIEKLIEAQRRKVEERMRGLDLEEMRRRLLEELRLPQLDRAGLDRALEQLTAARTPEELRRAIDLAVAELRRARGETPPVVEPLPVPEVTPAPKPAPMRQGLRLDLPSDVLRAQLGLEGGAVVRELDPAGPFAASGIAVHDIVLEAGGAKVAGPDAFAASLEALGPGQALAVVVLRRGQRVALELKK